MVQSETIRCELGVKVKVRRAPSGVGGIEAEAVMLGQPISMVLPEVVGYKVHGAADKFITSTDIVLTVTKVGGRSMQLFQQQSAL